MLPLLRKDELAALHIRAFVITAWWLRARWRSPVFVTAHEANNA
jgi:hypothetical protein